MSDNTDKNVRIHKCLLNLSNHYQELRKTLRDDEYADPDEDYLLEEYMELKSRTVTFHADEKYSGSLECNKKKNRYRDILPYEDTRVKLSELPGVECSDYINANFVQGIFTEKEYIASQAPLPSTLNDFWRMIWEHNVKVVIMACNEREGRKAKCERYWPTNQTESMTFGHITITLKSEEQHCDGHFVARRLQAQSNGVSRSIMQYHYTKWPDHGIPRDISPILKMLAVTRNYQPGSENSIVVHCSAGCGRTGTIIVIDYIWNLLKAGRINETISILDILTEMRKQRPALVQTRDQYALVYQCVISIFSDFVNMMDTHVYENYSNRQQRNTTAQVKSESMTLEPHLQTDSVTIVQDEQNLNTKIFLGTEPAKPSISKLSVKNKRAHVRHNYENIKPAAVLSKPAIKPKDNAVKEMAKRKSDSSSSHEANKLALSPTFKTTQCNTSSTAGRSKQVIHSSAPLYDSVWQEDENRESNSLKGSVDKNLPALPPRLYDEVCLEDDTTKGPGNVYANVPNIQAESRFSTKNENFTPPEDREECEYSLAYSDDNDTDSPTIPVKTPSAYEECEYSLAYDDDNNAEAPAIPAKTRAAYEDAAEPAYELHNPEEPTLKPRRGGSVKASTLNFFKDFKKKKDKFKPNGGKSNQHVENSNTENENMRSSNTFHYFECSDERMYRGVNVAYPNRVGKPTGPRGTPLAFKQRASNN